MFSRPREFGIRVTFSPTAAADLSQDQLESCPDVDVPMKLFNLKLAQLEN